MSEAPDPVSSRLGALVAAAAALPLVVGAVAALAGASLRAVLLLAVLVPLGLSTASAVVVLVVALRWRTPAPTGRAVSPDPLPVLPAPRKVRLSEELVLREIDVREAEDELVRAVARTAAPDYDELLGLADELRRAVLARAEAVAAAGGQLPPDLRDELVLRDLTPPQETGTASPPLPRLEE